MIYKIVEFKVKKDNVEEAKRHINEFSVKVEAESRTLSYDTYIKEDGVSFIHFVVFDSPEAEEYHQNTDYIKLFTSKLYPLCEVEPKFTTLYKF